MAQIVLILKPGKPAKEVTSYRPISLLSMLGKLFERLFLKRLKPLLAQDSMIPVHQFGFCEKHATIEQTHQIVALIFKAFETKKFCTAVFWTYHKPSTRFGVKDYYINLKLNYPAPSTSP